KGLNSNIEDLHNQEGGNDAMNTSMVLPDQVTFSSLLNGDNDAVEEQMICDFESTIPKEEPRDEIDIITSENVHVAERYQNLNISLEKEGHGREKTDRGFNLNQIPSQSPLPEVFDTPMMLPQPITFSSLLNGDDLAAEERMLFELQSSFPELEEAMGGQVKLDSPITARAAEEEEEYDTTLTLSLREQIHNIASEHATDPQRKLSISLGKQPIVIQHWDDRPLKRTIEVGESSTAKHQKLLSGLQKDPPSGIIVANEVIQKGIWTGISYSNEEWLRFLLEEAMGGQVKLDSPITARVAEEEEEYDTTLTLSLREQIHNIASEHTTDPQRKMSISLGKQLIVMQHWDDRPLKRTIEVGESSTAKHQKLLSGLQKDPPSGIIVANEVRNYNASNNTSRLMEVRNPIASNNTFRLMERRNYNLPIGTSEAKLSRKEYELVFHIQMKSGRDSCEKMN
ncbi:hypothetical protein RYX36_007021, partial [Vicia faba]